MSLNVLTQGGGTGGESASIFVTGLPSDFTVTAMKDGKTIRGKWVAGSENKKNNLSHPECIISTAGTTLYTYSNRNYKKAYDGSAFCASVIFGGWLTPLLVARTANAVAYYTDGDYSSGIMDYLATVEYAGETWYVSSTGAAFQTTTNPGGVLHINSITGVASYDTMQAAAIDLLGYVYQPVDGFEIKGIKEYGMWTVTATDGVDTATEDVLVDAALDFGILMAMPLLLYNHGDECTAVTGGWSACAWGIDWLMNPNAGFHEAMPTFSKNSDNMYISAPPACAGTVFTGNAIDLTPFSTLCWEGSVVSPVDHTSYDLVVTSEKKSKYTALQNGGLTTANHFEVDISNVDQLAFIGIVTCVSYDAGYNTSISTTKMWLK